jgi:hypothetical protein
MSFLHQREYTMATHDLSNVNTYPKFKTLDVSNTASKIILPNGATAISIGSPAALYCGNDGSDGDSFGDGGVIDYVFIPANNLLEIPMEIGRQSNRVLLVATQSGSSTLHIVINRSK